MKFSKKMLAVLTVVFLSAASISASAQNGGGGGGADRMAQYRQMLKDSVQLTDVQADSVMAIQQEFRPQMRTIFQDQSASQDDKTAKLKVLNDQIVAREQKFLTADQVQKLTDIQARMRARMRNRGGGGGGGN